MRRTIHLFLWLCLIAALVWKPALAVEPATHPHLVQPGDTWVALAWRYGAGVAELQTANPHFNRQRQPAIGRTVQIPLAEEVGLPANNGRLIRSNEGGLLQTAVRMNSAPWQLALLNEMPTPYRPLLHRPLFVPGGEAAPRDLPAGFDTLELSRIPARAGEALGFRAQTSVPVSVTVRLNDLPFSAFAQGEHLVGLVATGAFYATGNHELMIVPEGAPAWSQPWHMADQEWAYQQLTLTGTAAAIDAASIAAERERLFTIWSQVTPAPQWNSAFELPIRNYLSISSDYGVRRSYNGGPYRTYHEGVDFSAYGGTPVYAPAAGAVVLAEFLYVRGGAVILDHGLGIYTGYYHMSEVSAEVGQVVTPGQVIGAVGTTGLSTGNHLHWDLLVAETWIDAAA